MKYKLYNNNPSMLNPVHQILINRGIENPEEYINVSDDDLINYKWLDSMDEAINLFLSHFEKKNPIALIIDSDADGMASSSILYQYIKLLDKDYPITYLIHSKKQHGITDDIVIPDDINLVILPDAGSSDVEQCNKLSERNIDVLVLDHHELNTENTCAIIVNPYLSENYENKYLSGTGVVYKFLKALDDVLWKNYADKFLDMVALSLISDGMNLKIYENKRLVDLGLSKVENKLFKAFIKKQEYSLKEKLTVQGVQFYITPLINALIRSSTMAEKEMMFRAFCQIDEYFDYKKRSSDKVTDESIYDRVARIAVNAKARQNKEIDSIIVGIKKNIEKFKWNNNKILFVNSGDIDSNYTGLIAMKLAYEYQKPCVLIRETTWKKGVLAGSGRNYDGSPITNLKEFLSSVGEFNTQGHPEAFGIDIEMNKIKNSIELVNKELEDVSFEKIWTVDYILNPDDITYEFAKKCDSVKDIGQWECMVALTNVAVSSKEISIVGKFKDTLKLEINTMENFNCIKYKINEDEEIIKENEDWGVLGFILDIVGKLSISNFLIDSPQILIMDYNIVDIIKE